MRICETNSSGPYQLIEYYQSSSHIVVAQPFRAAAVVAQPFRAAAPAGARRYTNLQTPLEGVKFRWGAGCFDLQSFVIAAASAVAVIA